MATPQTVSFAGLPVIGLDMVVARGTKPGVARVRLVHNQNLNLSAGTLSIGAGGTANFAGMIPDLSTIRWEHRPHGKREFRVKLYDRRHGWRGKQVTGHYNKRRRDNTIEPATEKTANELADLALTAAGESPSSAALAFKPEVDWRGESVVDALDGISRVLPVHVCRQSNDSFAVMRTGTGGSLPASNGRIIPDYLMRADTGPALIRTRLGDTWFQCGLELECVGLEASGEYVARDNLSYTPSGGWADEWPLFFAGVDQFNRGFALRSLYRVYRVKVPQTLPFDYTLYDREDLLLDDFCVVFGEKHQPEATVVGTFYPYTDHYKNVANCPLHSAGFILDKELRAVRFDYPVWKAGACVDCADLRLYTGFRLRDPDTKQILRDELTVTRSTGSGEQTIDLPFLWRARSVYADGCSDGTSNDNESTMQAEAQTYLDAWKDHWDAVRDKRFMAYAGVENIGLSGNIAEVSYRLGRGLTPKTTASEHFRHSLTRT